MRQGSSHEELLARLGLDVANSPRGPTALFPHSPAARPPLAAARVATPAVPPVALAAAELTTCGPLAPSSAAPQPALEPSQSQSPPPPPPPPPPPAVHSTAQLLPQPPPQQQQPPQQPVAEETGFDPLSKHKSRTNSCSGRSSIDLPGEPSHIVRDSLSNDAIIVGVAVKGSARARAVGGASQGDITLLGGAATPMAAPLYRQLPRGTIPGETLECRPAEAKRADATTGVAVSGTLYLTNWRLLWEATSTKNCASCSVPLLAIGGFRRRAAGASGGGGGFSLAASRASAIEVHWEVFAKYNARASMPLIMTSIEQA